jgi:hypothetical protein
MSLERSSLCVIFTGQLPLNNDFEPLSYAHGI